MSDTSNKPLIRHYFVDEAGDPVLFNRRKKLVVGKPGCSHYFMLGNVDVENPTEVSRDMESLRQQLLSDPYFRGVPTMQPERRKTALAFHAKDDLPEVRREVFHWLEKQRFRFYAVIRDKRFIAQKVKEHNQKKPTYRYHPNQLYDRCVSQLFRERLHKDDAYKIYFARRGSSDRTEALRNALGAAKEGFYRKWGISSTAPIEILAGDSRTITCLQVVDYCLWGLQRFYERREDRFLNLIASNVALIHDVDDTRDSGAGVYYSQRNPLTLEACAKK